MVNWRGYLSGDREFFRGLTEINRSLPGSILLCKKKKKKKGSKATCLTLRLELSVIHHHNFVVLLALQLILVSSVLKLNAANFC